MKGIVRFWSVVIFCLGLMSGTASASSDVMDFDQACLGALIRDGQPDAAGFAPKRFALGLSHELSPEFQYFETDRDFSFLQVNERLKTCGLVVIDAHVSRASEIWHALERSWTFEHRIEPQFLAAASDKHNGVMFGKSRGVIRVEEDVLVYVVLQFVGAEERGQLNLNAFLTNDRDYYCDLKVRECT